MKKILQVWLIPFVLIIGGGIGLFFWLGGEVRFELRLPGADNRPEEDFQGQAIMELAAEAEQFDGVAADILGTWPNFRGADLDAISKEDVKLSRSWPAGGPEKLWSIDLGEGYAGAAIFGGRVFILDYDQENKADVVRCLSLEDGRDIWKYSYPVTIKRNHGMSRTTPAVREDYIVTIGPKCHVFCLDTNTGKFKWMIDLVSKYKTKVPLWYAGQCPLVEDGKAIIAPGGDMMMIAVDCNSGEVLWERPNEHGWAMTHASIIPMEFAGKRMYIYCSDGGTVAVSAEDGSLLWETDKWELRTIVPSPVIVGKNRIFLSAGYEKGSMMLELKAQAERIEPEILFTLPPEKFGATQQSPVYYEGFIYGIRPDEELVCLGPSGNIVWRSTPNNKFGLGPLMIADGLIYAMNDDGVLTMAEATSSGYVELGEAKVLDGHESWGPMAIAGGRLIVRDLTKMVCLDVSEQ